MTNKLFLLPLFVACFVVSVSSQNTNELVSVAVIYRHGDRTPLVTYPNDPHKDVIFGDLEPGELTNVGKQRQYELGKWLSTHYADFLSDKYTPKDVRVVSDDMDRCLMSAAANFAGLYPPKDNQIWNDDLLWQPVPIHTNRNMLYVEATCLRMDFLLAELYLSEYVLNIDKENAELYQYLTNNTGEFFGTLMQIQSIRDVLYIESKLNLELPDWTKSVYPEKLDKLGAIVFSLLSNNTELSKFTTGIFFNDVLENFENPSRKFNAYSAHDSNVASVIYTLAPSHEKFCPQFASMVILELWRKDGKNVVQAFLKDTDMVVPIYIENCGDDCELEKFREVLKDVAVTEEQWKEDCLKVL